MDVRPYQLDALRALWQFLQRPEGGHPIVAMPTGTGKSIVIGEFVRGTVQHTNARVLMLTHVKELIDQNFQKLLAVWPTAPAGVYSAGLGRKDIAQITYAGIASSWRNPAQFGHVDYVLVDECHLVSPKDGTMYLKLFDALRAVNPRIRFIGLSATPYRLGMGSLTEEGGLFTDIAFDLCTRASFNKLVDDGYLSPLVTKKTERELDVSGVRMAGGEFVLQDLQIAADNEMVTYYALQEMCRYGHTRGSWLVFTTGIDHTDHVAEMLRNEFGIAAEAVHSKVPAAVRDQRIRAHKAGALRCLVNNNVLTTGYDNPEIDLIGVLRPTNSPVLWVQMLGRGTRVLEGKRDCLVLDFAGNTRRLGPINDPAVPRKKGKSGRVGMAPVKVCEQCSTYNHATALFCTECGFEFHRSVKYEQSADTAPVVAANAPLPEIHAYGVTMVTYREHRKPDRPVSLRVTYYCGLQRFEEWVCLEHSGLALHKAHLWWRARYPYAQGEEKKCPRSVHEALAETSALKQPKTIHVWTNRKHPEITRYEF